MSTAVAQPAQGEAEVVVDCAANSASNASGKDSWVQQTGILLISNLLCGHAALQRYSLRDQRKPFQQAARAFDKHIRREEATIYLT